MKRIFLSCLAALLAVLPAFGEHSMVPFSHLSLKEMYLYLHLAEAIEGGYMVQHTASREGDITNERASYLNGSYRQRRMGYDCSAWTVDNPFSPTGQTSCIVFHGSDTMADWLTDLHTGMIGYMVSRHCPIPRRGIDPQDLGVYQLGKAAESIDGLLNTYGGSDPNNPPYITGHSLGGGMAQSAYLARNEKHKNAGLFIINPMGLPSLVYDKMSKAFNPNVTIIINGTEILQFLNDITDLSHLGGRICTMPPSRFFLSFNEHTISNTLAKMRLLIAQKEMMVRPVIDPHKHEMISYFRDQYLPVLREYIRLISLIQDHESAVRYEKDILRQRDELGKCAAYIIMHYKAELSSGFTDDPLFRDYYQEWRNLENAHFSHYYRLAHEQYFGVPLLRKIGPAKFF